MNFQAQQYNPDPSMYIRSSDQYGYGVPQQTNPQSNIFQPPNQYNQNEFNNIQPRTRFERDIQRDNELSQKAKFVQKTQFTPQLNDVKSLLHNPDPQTTLFIPEQERFQKDFAGQERYNREQKKRLEQMKYEQRRIASLERQGNIWQREEELYRRVNFDLNNKIGTSQTRLPYIIIFERQKKCKWVLRFDIYNFSLAYNPLTLQYADTEQGQQLRQQDENAKVRGMVRAQNLDARSNCGYNLLTGDGRQGVETIVPQHLRDQFQQKVQEKDQYYDMKFYARQQYAQDSQTKSRYY